MSPLLAVFNVQQSANRTASHLVGGLVGSVRGSGTTLRNSYSTATLSGDGVTPGTGGTSNPIYTLGGLVGTLIDSGTIANCYATGNIVGGGASDNLGGLVGDVGP